MPSATSSPVSASNEWSPLKSVIVGRASHSCFPSEPRHMIEATMPKEHQKHFHGPPNPCNPFPADLLARADAELDNLAQVLQDHGVKVYRPDVVDFRKIEGYTAAMPRDGLMAVGNTILESCYAWRCRKHEISLAFSTILEELASGGAKVVRAPALPDRDTIYDGLMHNVTNGHANGQSTNGHNGEAGERQWAINNTRPAFDCADFLRFGTTLIGQLSHVTNPAGVEYVRAALPGCTVELLDVFDPHAMHIDATLLPLREGLLVYNGERVSEAELRRHAIFKDWKLLAYPHTPKNVGDTELFMTSPWIAMNVLILDEQTILAEERETEFAEWIEALGIKVIRVPFRGVNSIGGSFHCATVDLKRGN